MRALLAILLAGGALISPSPAVAEQKRLDGTPPYNLRRQSMTCEETYGENWITCGDESSPFCYSPALGQSCCDTDNGYCDAGTHCAPVAGYCCLNGEDLASCARDAGFELPAGEVVTPGAGLRMPVGVQDRFRAGGFSNSSTMATNSSRSADRTSRNTSDSNVRYVQVSVARQHRGTLAWMATGIGAVGLFMFSC